MATGISIHVGVNATEAPEINAPVLLGCEKDAEAMHAMARARGFVTVDDGDADVPIIKEAANLDNVLGKIRIAAEQLNAGDIFLFSFSGHGSRRGQEDPTETDLQDETLVLQDKLLVDNVLRRHLWPKFRKDVRVVMVSDSCHSGGAAMSSVVDSESEPAVVAALSTGGVVREVDFGTAAVRRQCQTGFRIRSVPESQAQAHFDLLKEFYKELRDGLPNPAPPVPASFLLLAACREFETTLDGPQHGVFTAALLEVLSTNGTKTYTQLKDAIRERVKVSSPDSHPVVVGIPDSPSLADTEAFKI